MAMWLNCLRYVGPNGVFVSDMVSAARTETNLRGMTRWGYISVDGKPPFATLKRGGRVARAHCEPLIGEIEGRWSAALDLVGLRSSLVAVVRRLSPDLPDCMPILHYGLACSGPSEVYGSSDCSSLPLPFLIARVLLAFALEYERRCDVSLAIGGNVLRVLGPSPVLVKELPGLSGVSKESLAMATGFLAKRGLIEIVGSPKSVALTAGGLAARGRHFEVVSEVEADWGSRFDLASLLSALANVSQGFLWECMEPYPEGWRAKVRRPTVIPHFPMVLHRGGYPDGT